MILLVFLAILWYYRGDKVKSLLVFFFFLTDGFQLIPESLFGLGIPMQPTDYALIYMGLILIINILLKRPSILSGLNIADYIFCIFFICSVSLSYFVYGIPLGEIVKTIRFFLLFFSVFLFLEIDKEDIEKIRNSLLYITVFQSILYCLQLILGIGILNGYIGGGLVEIGGIAIPRFYNLPKLGLYFLFFVCEKDENQKIKMSYLVILGLPILLSLSRALILSVFIAYLLLIYVKNTSLSLKLRRFLLFVIFSSLLFPVLSTYFQERGGGKDLLGIINGEFRDIDYVEELGDQTFLFRVAHFYERFSYLTENNTKLLFGAGWMHEKSFYTQQNFDFKIGLRDEEYEVAQIDTSDIAWSTWIMRFGIIGTIIYWIVVTNYYSFFYKRRDTRVGGAAFALITIFLITSFTSVMIVTPMAFVILMMDRVFLVKSLGEFSDCQSQSFNYMACNSIKNRI